MRTATSILGRATACLVATLTLLTLLAGVPAFLASAFGWPLPTSVPTSSDKWGQLLTAPVLDSAIPSALAIAGWLLWAAFARAVGIEARDAGRGVHTAHRRPGFHPLRALASVLIGTIAAGSFATGAADAAAAPVAAAHRPSAIVASVIVASADVAVALVEAAPRKAPAAAVHVRAPMRAARVPPAGPAILKVNGNRHLHTVGRGVSRWEIANVCLNAGNRWPEIWRLNERNFWPEVSGHKRFNDPDLIYPRWTREPPALAAISAHDPEVVPADPAPTPDPEATPPSGQATPALATPIPTPEPAVTPTTAPPSSPPAEPAPAPSTMRYRSARTASPLFRSTMRAPSRWLRARSRRLDR
jgi:hypothetical protein